MSVTVSGTLTINVEGLEEQLHRLNDLKAKINSKIQDIIQRVSKVSEADNWPNLQEGSEQLKKIYQAALDKIESKSDRVKAEINKVLEQIKQTENNVQNKFDDLITNFRTRLQSIFGGGTLASALTGFSNDVKTGVTNFVSKIKDFGETLKQRITSKNGFGSIGKLFSNPQVESTKEQIAEAYINNLSSKKQLSIIKGHFVPSNATKKITMEPFNLGDTLPKDSYSAIGLDPSHESCTAIHYEVVSTPVGEYKVCYKYTWNSRSDLITKPKYISYTTK